MFSLPQSGYCQNQTVKVYETDSFGIRSTLPSQVIEVEESGSTTTIRSYDTSDSFGLKSYLPDREIVIEKEDYGSEELAELEDASTDILLGDLFE
jgi:hypothetical protein